MDRLQELMLWSFGVLAWMSVALSSFGTQDQQIAGHGGFDRESSQNMIFFGYVSTAMFCLVAWYFTKHLVFLMASIVVGVGGYWWVYKMPHPILTEVNFEVI